jgi:outer membrane immunogenic protein
MKFLPLTALALTASLSAAPAFAQDDMAAPRTFEPYVGIMGGSQDFDDELYSGGPPSGYRGWLVEGVGGVNVNMGRFFVGAEGSVAKGVDKDIDWEYGAAGRAGVRIGQGSNFFLKAGYQWTQFHDSARPVVNPDTTYDGTIYGFGAEVSPADLGISQSLSNLRLRGQVDTRGDFHSFRPMAGIVWAF